RPGVLLRQRADPRARHAGGNFRQPETGADPAVPARGPRSRMTDRETLVLADIYEARRLIAGTVTHTPLVPSHFMSHVVGRDFLLKLEFAQPTGAFKRRGAANAVLRLPEGASGVVCCSTGNHGRGVAYAAKARGIRAVVCMSSLVPKTKVDGIRALGAE